MKSKLLQLSLFGILLFQTLAAGAQTVTRVSAGQYFSVFVMSDGSLWTMGYNDFGQLGDGGAVAYTNVPQMVVSSGVTSVSANAAHTVFTKSDDSLWTIGSNFYGESGSSSANVPTKIVSTSVRFATAGAYHTLFRETTGSPIQTTSLWGMGNNGLGQLGNGTTTGSSSPEQLQSTQSALNMITALAGGQVHSVYLHLDGTAWAMGDNAFGQLGINSTNNQSSPVQLTLTNVTAIAAGFDNSFFLKGDTSLWGTGENDHYELGDNTQTTRLSPVLIATNVASVYGGYGHTLFIKTDGSLWGMGDNVYGELGGGTNTMRQTPVQLVASNVVSAAVGYTHSLFIKTDGSLWGMGDNTEGQLGDGTYTNRHTPVQIVPFFRPRPKITHAQISGLNLIFTGTNGQSGRTYYTMMSTNAALPVASWLRVSTNTLGVDGNFTFTATNAAAISGPRRFYLLQFN